MNDQELLGKYHLTIGIECHVQLDTVTKLFAPVDNNAEEASPNSVVSQLCFGLPGTLPVLNQKAVELAVVAGLGMNAKIEKFSKFDRKHYFYPDLPKGYQITQYDQPTVSNGSIAINVDGVIKRIGIERAHIEEDAGKLVHHGNQSMVDLNRAGTPLIEIVSRPDMHSAIEAKTYARELYLIMKMTGVSRANLFQGNMRFDVNVSVAPQGVEQLGTRAEIKNLNSFRSIERAVNFEHLRQAKLLEDGGNVTQETRGWNETSQSTYSMRSKEDAQDYRYFPEPDLPAIVLDQEYINSVESQMKHLPMMLGGGLLTPHNLRRQLQSLELDSKSIEAFLDHGSDNQILIEVFLKLLEDQPAAAKFAFNYMVNELFAQENISFVPSATQFEQVYLMLGDGKLNSSAAKTLLSKLGDNDQDVAQFAEDQGLVQLNDQAQLELIINQVIADNSQAVEDYKKGNDRAIGSLIGAVMKASGGKANPTKVKTMLESTLT